jgi:hypothetical protein
MVAISAAKVMSAIAMAMTSMASKLRPLSSRSHPDNALPRMDFVKVRKSEPG